MTTKCEHVSLVGPIWGPDQINALRGLVGRRVRLASMGLGTMRGQLATLRRDGVEFDHPRKRGLKKWFIPFEAMLFVEEL